jgi:dienelactone hydrolase
MKKFVTLVACCFGIVASAQLKAVSYADGRQKLNGFAAAPAKPLAEKPGILILPAWKGIDDHCKEVAQDLANLGYHAFIADIYGEGNYPKDTKEAGERSGFYKKNYEAYQQRIAAALAGLVKSGANAEKIVVIGYCFGGAGALEAARSGMPVKGVVSFHGSLGKDPSRPNNGITAKVLICHGADDPYVSAADLAGIQQEMRESKADWQMVYYANAVHAFTEKAAGNDNSKGAAYNEKADRRSWQHMLDFLAETLK